jgi:hypothetical protein
VEDEEDEKEGGYDVEYVEVSLTLSLSLLGWLILSPHFLMSFVTTLTVVSVGF